MAHIADALSLNYRAAWTDERADYFTEHAVIELFHPWRFYDGRTGETWTLEQASDDTRADARRTEG